jgi:ribosomal protein L11 methyltransferase
LIDYIELNCRISPLSPGAEIIIAKLSEQGFESFAETETGVLAYIPAHLFSKEKLIFPESGDFIIHYSTQLIKGKNWNEEWEKNFQPVIVDQSCCIRASFHPKNTSTKFDIIIDPKMAFGTGHHETTVLMVKQMLATELKEKATLDMGCGTGVLAILASKLGAFSITAIDNDVVAVDSAIENAAKNHALNILAICGDASSVKNNKFDVILANINRNILLNDLPAYCASLNQNGIVILSGYLKADVYSINNKAIELGLSLVDTKENHDWVAQKFRKNNLFDETMGISQKIH